MCIPSLLSAADMPACLMLDDTLDVLPWARQTLTIDPLPPHSQDDLSPDETKLKELQASLRGQIARCKRILPHSVPDTQPVGSLVAKAKTIDQARCFKCVVGARATLPQAKAILTFVEAISEKTLRSTVALTAARGRGKSAALGLAIAAAVAYRCVRLLLFAAISWRSYSNIFVTSPSPENLKTLFEFVFKGFDALGYHVRGNVCMSVALTVAKEHTDYELIQSANPEFNKAVVRVNIFTQDHRQTIQARKCRNSYLARDTCDSTSSRTTRTSWGRRSWW